MPVWDQPVDRYALAVVFRRACGVVDDITATLYGLLLHINILMNEDVLGKTNCLS